MLTGVMTLMMSNGGDAEGAFLYGVDRAYMTVFGVLMLVARIFTILMMSIAKVKQTRINSQT